MAYLLMTIFFAFCALIGCGSNEKSTVAEAKQKKTDNTAPPSLSQNTSKAAPKTVNRNEPIGYQRDDYYFLRNAHKSPMRHGATRGWDLVVRKSDNCLLVIESEGGPTGAPTLKRENRYYPSGRFEYSPEELPTYLEKWLSRQKVPSDKIAQIIRTKDDCPDGHHILEKTGRATVVYNSDDYLQIEDSLVFRIEDSCLLRIPDYPSNPIGSIERPYYDAQEQLPTVRKKLKQAGMKKDEIEKRIEQIEWCTSGFRKLVSSSYNKKTGSSDKAQFDP